MLHQYSLSRIILSYCIRLTAYQFIVSGLSSLSFDNDCNLSSILLFDDPVCSFSGERLVGKGCRLIFPICSTLSPLPRTY